ncbi:MAG TPA: Ig-like domain-containing protein [Candidatus Sulfotelmatobacter sp.]
MSSMRRKLHVAGAVAALALLALAVSCRGFFQNPVLTSIAISPTAPQVAVNTQLSPALQVFGTYDDGSRSQVKSGVSWSSSAPQFVSIDSVSGVITGVAVGTATITASAQALSATASATSYLSGVTSMTVSPTTGSIIGTQTQLFTFQAVSTNGPVFITTDNGGLLTITPSTSDITCIPSGNAMACSGDGATTETGPFNITMTYPGTNASATAVLTASP